MTLEVTQPRARAFAQLMRVEEDGAWLDRVTAHDQALKAMGRRDRALTDALAATSLQRQITLDHLISELAGRPAESIQVPVRVALRLGLAQTLFMDGIADHAAVSQTVGLLQARGEKGFANAILRRSIREREQLLGALDDSTPQGAALAHSMPQWIVESWWERFGPKLARGLLAAQNVPGETALRINGLDGDREAGLSALKRAGVTLEAAAWPDGALIARGPLDIDDDELRRRVIVQARGAQLAVSMLAPADGSTVVELCSAPGGKTLGLAESVGASGRVVAVEADSRRAKALATRVKTMGAGGRVDVVNADAADFGGVSCDFVLVDPPCSALGILRSRPDRRHHAHREAISGLVALQKRILRSAIRALSEGGTLVWCTCTTTIQENEEVLAPAIDSGVLEPLGSDGQALDGTVEIPEIGGRLVLPQPGDGFVVAALRRTAVPVS